MPWPSTSPNTAGPAETNPADLRLGAYREVSLRYDHDPVLLGASHRALSRDPSAADLEAGPTIRVAALTLAPLVRAELEARLAGHDHTELALISGLRAAGTAWAQIGRALGTTRQGAAQRAERLTARTAPHHVNGTLTDP
jgi:hypothetical protein